MKERTKILLITILLAIIFTAIGYVLCDFVNKSELVVRENQSSSLYLKAKNGQPDFITFVAPGNFLLPLALTTPEKARIKAIITAYNPTVAQCDSTPDIMASGKKVYEGAIANNCLPFGTKVEIDNRTYTVEDRMNNRYGCNYFDIFIWSSKEAVEWGRKTKEVEIY